LRLKKRAVAARIDKLVDKGLVEKKVVTEGGTFTYFHLKEGCCWNDRGCCPDDKGVLLERQPKSNILHSNIKKEKYNKKKESEGDPSRYNEYFESFKSKALTDGALDYNLASYSIKDKGALIDEFCKHVVKIFKIKEFANNGYMKNCAWLLRSLNYLDLTAAIGVKLGYNEYLKDGKRYYINRRKREIEVPMAAPPRRSANMIWDAETMRWIAEQ